MSRFSSLALVLTTLALSFAAAGLASPAAAQSNTAWPDGKAAHYSNGALYDMVPPSAPNGFSDDPSRTGGGSIGYNQMIYNW
jgi:hypothetical protein